MIMSYVIFFILLITLIVIFLLKKKYKIKYKCYVINLIKNTDRMETFYSYYYKSDIRKLTLERFNAIDGKLIDIKKYVTSDAYEQILNSERTGYRKHHYELTKGAVGCFLSHASLFEKLYNDPEYDYYIIFEDDVHIPSKVLDKINFIINNAPRDWDILLLGSLREILLEKNVFYDKIKSWWGLFGYVINKKASQKFLDVYKRGKIDKQIDSMLSLMVIENNLNVYSPHIHVISHNSVGTDIQLPIQNDNTVNPYMYKNIELFSDF